MTLKIMLVDDQDLVRGGFAMILGANADMTVVAEAGDGAEAVEAARLHRPDVILMDVRMPVLDGIEATERILAQADWNVHIIILTTFDPDEYVFRALKAGASAFVLKDSPADRLAEAVRTVAAGGALLAPTITRRLISRFTEPQPDRSAAAERLGRLTERERDIVAAVSRGLTNMEISQEAFIGTATVKSHISSILTKLGLRDRTQIVVFAYESGLIHPGHNDIGN